MDALGEPDGLLTYYGVSYGTVLGVTFAAMFPDKVGRMVLDAVVSQYWSRSVISPILGTPLTCVHLFLPARQTLTTTSTTGRSGSRPRP